MDKNRKILSDIITFTKYARYIPALKRRETWEEIVQRNAEMHVKRFPELEDEIWKAYSYVLDKKVLPSMRSAQFAGQAAEIANQRIYNCSLLTVDSIDAFSETMHLLLVGCGVGYSVQLEDVEKLPSVKIPKKFQRFLVGDSIAGWADAVKVLMRAFLDPVKKTRPKFDFRDIRPKGSLLVTSGGKAPGPEPLKIALTKIEAILEEKPEGSKLTTLEAHDILCHIADAVLAGGIRRAAMIAFFSPEDHSMMACKTGKWYELNPQRARANNSVVFLRQELTKETFDSYWEYLENSGSGEPGFILTNDRKVLSNPCVTGDTQLLTDKGSFPIAELVGQKVNIWNGKEWSEVVPFSTGVNEILQVSLSNGTNIDCTLYHKFILDGNIKEDAVNLRVGDKLQSFLTPEGEAQNFIFVTRVTNLHLQKETFCVTEPKNHTATFNGIVTGQCGEVALNYHQFCNLTTINGVEIYTQDQLEEYSRVAAFIGTLQASYTDFYYLRPEWAEVTEKEALLGVSITGWASGVHNFDIEKAAKVVLEENERVAKLLGINKAARTTLVKPDGCLTLDSTVRTTDGVKTMAEIVSMFTDEDFFELPSGTWLVSDANIKIFNENNEEEMVSKVFINGMSEVFEIEMEDGSIVKMTPEHRLKTKNGWKKAKDLTVDDELIAF